MRRRHAAFEEFTLDTPGLGRFNAASPEAAEAALLSCCGSRRWAQRLAGHRPYATLDVLLAAADEASYDLSFADLTEALARESPVVPHPGTPPAAQTALRAAHAAYESRFGHAFVISFDGHQPEDCLNHVLAEIHTRLSHDPDKERSVAADELRRLARSRIPRAIAGLTGCRPGRRPGRQPESGAELHTVSPAGRT
ncbi:2-oxo-4-hydroxy-4-carboxy-5-ureidoimidazoline decarboxylase [Streptomyces sp. NPDC088725]|uniref:2-oxo-4-hydroxy-4-carboxy-5-ureidoimidazoline decarboxylase n=1 Tax=Streptomyces sp. NPDC088725 TaxID=3365873 RepID=UPI00382AF201